MNTFIFKDMYYRDVVDEIMNDFGQQIQDEGINIIHETIHETRDLSYVLTLKVHNMVTKEEKFYRKLYMKGKDINLNNVWFFFLKELTIAGVYNVFGFKRKTILPTYEENADGKSW